MSSIAQQKQSDLSIPDARLSNFGCNAHSVWLEWFCLRGGGRLFWAHQVECRARCADWCGGQSHTHDRRLQKLADPIIERRLNNTSCSKWSEQEEDDDKRRSVMLHVLCLAVYWVALVGWNRYCHYSITARPRTDQNPLCGGSPKKLNFRLNSKIAALLL